MSEERQDLVRLIQPKRLFPLFQIADESQSDSGFVRKGALGQSGLVTAFLDKLR